MIKCTPKSDWIVFKNCALCPDWQGHHGKHGDQRGRHTFEIKPEVYERDVTYTEELSLLCARAFYEVQRTTECA